MRGTFGRLAATTGVALALAVLVATPAEARRNVGGTVPAGATCLSPGHSEARSDRADDVLNCFCYIAPAPPSGPKDGERNVGGLLPDMITNCPPGILKQHGFPPG